MKPQDNSPLSRVTIAGHKINVSPSTIYVYLAEIHKERSVEVLRSDVFQEHADALTYLNEEGEAGGYGEVIAYDITKPQEPERRRAVYRTDFPDDYVRMT